MNFYSDSTVFLDATATSLPSRPVRTYCDICEEFDRHDTDDCPTQDNTHYVVKNENYSVDNDDDDDETF